MKSCLYSGTVWHRREEPAYRFRYSVWYLGIYLDERKAVDDAIACFSHNGRNLTSMWDRDYMALEQGIESYAPGIEYAAVQLVTMPRFLGFVFNPVSFFLLRDAHGRLVHVLAEVHNTWGERHVYSLARNATDRSQTAAGALANDYASEAEKVFYVSPFIEMAAHYDVSLKEAASGRLTITLSESDEAGLAFEAGISIDPAPLSQRNVVWLLLRFPFVNLKTVAAIHWQGFKLWWRGERFRPNPSRNRLRRAKGTQL